ncbi:Ankyrin-3 [Penicillium rolfsii]|nr:Ankyrin-3 [Penicillium rolfsii]
MENKSKNMPPNLGDLPPEMVQQIGQSLDTPSLLRLARSCTSLYWLLLPEIRKRAKTAALAPLSLYEENFIYDEEQQHGIDDPVFSLHASYSVPAGKFGASNSDVLGKAVERGDFDTVQGLLKHNVDPSSYIVSGERLISLAIQSRRVDMVRLLLGFGAGASRPDLITNTSPLIHAARGQKDEIVRLLIEAGGDLNADRVMQAIAAYCTYETMKMALAYGGNPAAFSSNGLTVLHSVVKRNDIRLFNLVKDKFPAAILNAQDQSGRTALQTALNDEDEYSYLAMPLACDPEVDVDIQDMYGYTALHLAIRSKRLDVAEVLIQRGANVNLVTIHRENSLYLALESRSVPLIRRLVERGADRVCEARGFGRIYFWARYHDDSEIRSIFE